MLFCVSCAQIHARLKKKKHIYSAIQIHKQVANFISGHRLPAVSLISLSGCCNSETWCHSDFSSGSSKHLVASYY